ncbi:MAG: alpha-galactosidase, partial [Chitinophagaceae bacterium]
TIWQGDLYRLVNPWKTNSASLMYASADGSSAVVFNYLTDRRYNNNPSTAPVKLKGLNAAKTYRVSEINLYPGQKSVTGDNKVLTGEFLMNVGINMGLGRSHPSVVIRVDEVR